MKKLMILLLLALPLYGRAQTTVDNGQELIDTFFQYYASQGHTSAFQYAFSTNRWLQADGDPTQPISSRLTKATVGMGKYIGYEEIRSRMIGSRFRVVNLLVYYQRDPVLFTFELYKNDLGWEIANVGFDVKFEREIQEALRLPLNN